MRLTDDWVVIPRKLLELKQSCRAKLQRINEIVKYLDDQNQRMEAQSNGCRWAPFVCATTIDDTGDADEFLRSSLVNGSFPSDNILSAMSESVKPTTPTPTRKIFANKKLSGFVYAMKNKRNGYTKIGFSKRPEYRESTLQAEDPDVELVFSFPGTPADESVAHERYKQHRLRGEWFTLSAQQLAELKALLGGQL